MCRVAELLRERLREGGIRRESLCWILQAGLVVLACRAVSPSAASCSHAGRTHRPRRPGGDRLPIPAVRGSGACGDGAACCARAAHGHGDTMIAVA